MKTVEKIKNFISELQKLSEEKKKIIFFTVVIASALILGFFGVISTKNNMAKISKSLKSINFPRVDMYDANLHVPDIRIDEIENMLSAISGGDQEIFQNQNELPK